MLAVTRDGGAVVADSNGEFGFIRQDRRVGGLPSGDEKGRGEQVFFRAENNWNQVCNAGMIYGALATYERAPEYCKALIEKCLASNPTAQKCYDPDGGYPEGFSYWDYGTGFEVMLVAALQSALGTDAGIAAQESFMRSASFMSIISELRR